MYLLLKLTILNSRGQRGIALEPLAVVASTILVSMKKVVELFVADQKYIKTM